MTNLNHKSRNIIFQKIKKSMITF